MVINFLLLIFVSLLIEVLPAIYKGQLDAMSAMLLGLGVGFVIWFLVRLQSIRK